MSKFSFFPKRHLLIFFLLITHLNLAFSSEVDSFTQRDQKLQDATHGLNQVVNERLLLALGRANAIKGCSLARVYQGVRELFTGPILGQVEQIINRGDLFEKRVIPRSSSVLGPIGPITGAALYVYGLGSVIQVGEHVVGADKFGHFFSEGWTYFDRAVLKKQDLIQVLRFGQRSETGFFGTLMTGVFSYADLATNFNGLRFWINLVKNDPRVLERHYGLKEDDLSLVDCVEGQWRLVKAFDWTHYIDASWDEGINCNAYPNETLTREINEKISMVLQHTSLQPKCPVQPYLCPKLMEKYKLFSLYLLHPECGRLEKETRANGTL